MNPYYSAVLMYSEIGLRKQVVKKNDYIDANGLLVCGNCGENRRDYMVLDDPTPQDPNHKFKFIIPRPCKCERDKEERKQRLIQMENDMDKLKTLQAESLMSKRFQNAKFSNFVVTDYNRNTYEDALYYAQNFDYYFERSEGRVYWGATGTGKTFTAACIANYLLERHIPVVMTSLSRLITLIQEGTEKESVIISRMNKAKLVIFDDLGAERTTTYALEKVYNIIDGRYQAELPMIFTTNLTPAEMKDETDLSYKRIYSRVLQGCTVHQCTAAKDMRLVEANKKFEENRRLHKELKEGR